MPYGVGGAIAEGMQSGFEMGRSVSQDAEKRREFDAEQAIRKEQADRLMKMESDRYGRMQDAAQVKAVEDHLTGLDKLADGMQAQGKTVDPRINEMRAQAHAQLDSMYGQIAATGRLGTAAAPAAGVQGAITAPVSAAPAAPAAAAPLPDLSQSGAPAGAPQGGVQGAAPPVTGSPPAGMPATDPLQPGAGAPGGVSGALPASATTAPTPAVAGGVPQAATVASPTTSATTPQQQLVTQTDQDAQNLASRLQTGQTSLNDVAPKDLALMVASATKHPPDDLSGLNQGIADFHAGMATGNNGLAIQGLNGIYGPSVNTGIGQPSAFGGNIVSKKIIGLDPAMSADGTVHPDRVMPRLEVTTDQKNPDGTNAVYHAPIIGADGKVVSIPMADAFNHVGAMGALSAVAAHPDAQAALAQGAKDPAVQQYFDAYNSMATPVSKADILENHIQATMSRLGIDHDTAEQMYVRSGDIPWQLSAPRNAAQGDVAAATQLMRTDPVKYPTLDAALGAIRATTHGYSKYGPGSANVGPAGGGVQGNPGSGSPAAPINPVSGSRVLPAPDKNGLILGYTPRAIDDRAWDFADRGGAALINMGRGKEAEPAKKAIENRAGELLSNAGVTPGQYAMGTQQFKANARSLSLQQLRGDAIDSSMSKITNDFGTIDSTISSNADIAPFLAKPLNALRSGSGISPGLAGYQLAVKQVATEYERLLTGGQLSTAQLHDGARQDAENILNGDMTVAQVNNVIPVMKREMLNAQSATHGEINTIRGRLSTLGSGDGAATPAAGSPLPGGVQGAVQGAAPPVAPPKTLVYNQATGGFQ